MGMHAAMAGFDYTQKSQESWEHVSTYGTVLPSIFMGTVASDEKCGSDSSIKSTVSLSYKNKFVIELYFVW